MVKQTILASARDDASATASACPPLRLSNNSLTLTAITSGSNGFCKNGFPGSSNPRLTTSSSAWPDTNSTGNPGLIVSSRSARSRPRSSGIARSVITASSCCSGLPAMSSASNPFAAGSTWKPDSVSARTSTSRTSSSSSTTSTTSPEPTLSLGTAPVRAVAAVSVVGR